MIRFYPRIKVQLSAAIGFDRQKAEIVELSPSSIFLKPSDSILSIHRKDISIEGPVVLTFSLPGYGRFEYSCNIARRDKDGYVLIPNDIDLTGRMKLWQFVAKRLAGLNTCPYCGRLYESLPLICSRCGWMLDFTSPNYFGYHERTLLLLRLFFRCKALPTDKLRRVINFLDTEIEHRAGSEAFQEFVGTCPEMLEVFSIIRRVAVTDIPVLIAGESGTGKELTALAIHERSSRSSKSFVTINCASIPENLLESELFGYQRGAFTGAVTTKKGLLEMADGGTLFLDEIGELPANLQAKLLRFLEDGMVRKLGSNEARKIDVRIISATNRDLEKSVGTGTFRADLYWRLNGFPLRLPPLRERGEDKIILSRYFLKKFSTELKSTAKEFTRDALMAIEEYHWPGNVRELINRIRRACVMTHSELVTAQDMGLENILSSSLPPCSLRSVTHTNRRELIIKALAENNFVISRAALSLNISRQRLHTLIKQYSINIEELKRKP